MKLTKHFSEQERLNEQERKDHLATIEKQNSELERYRKKAKEERRLEKEARRKQRIEEEQKEGQKKTAVAGKINEEIDLTDESGKKRKEEKKAAQEVEDVKVRNKMMISTLDQLGLGL